MCFAADLLGIEIKALGFCCGLSEVMLTCFCKLCPLPSVAVFSFVCYVAASAQWGVDG